MCFILYNKGSISQNVPVPVCMYIYCTGVSYKIVDALAEQLDCHNDVCHTIVQTILALVLPLCRLSYNCRQSTLVLPYQPQITIFSHIQLREHTILLETLVRFLKKNSFPWIFLINVSCHHNGQWTSEKKNYKTCH